MTALLVGGPLLVALALISMVFPPAAVVTVPLKVVVSSFVVAWDLLDYPFGLRKMRVRERLAWMRANLGSVLLFGASAGALLLVPLLGLFMLPCGVAAATEPWCAWSASAQPELNGGSSASTSRTSSACRVVAVL